ncbi:MAG: hypothetical protein Q8Q33_06945 [Chlamydiota bacterium]|nr:hypothetical protein [Chlamydiota bacterium]
MTKIKDLPKHKRPREKLLERGAESLSDAELLAILLRTGTLSFPHSPSASTTSREDIPRGITLYLSVAGLKRESRQNEIRPLPATVWR